MVRSIEDINGDEACSIEVEISNGDVEYSIEDSMDEERIEVEGFSIEVETSNDVENGIIEVEESSSCVLCESVIFKDEEARFSENTDDVIVSRDIEEERRCSEEKVCSCELLEVGLVVAIISEDVAKDIDGSSVETKKN